MDISKILWSIFFYKIPSAIRMKNHIPWGSMILQDHTVKLKRGNTVNPSVPLLNLAVLKPTWKKKKDQTRCPQDIPTSTCLKPCFILLISETCTNIFFYALIKQKKMCALQNVFFANINPIPDMSFDSQSPSWGDSFSIFFFFSGGCRESRLDCISWIFICCLSGVYPEGRTDVVHSTLSLALC